MGKMNHWLIHLVPDYKSYGMYNSLRFVRAETAEKALAAVADEVKGAKLKVYEIINLERKADASGTGVVFLDMDFIE